MAEVMRDLEDVRIGKVRYESYMAYPGPPADESIQALFTVDLSYGSSLSAAQGSNLLTVLDQFAVEFHNMFKADPDPNYEVKLRRIMIPVANLEAPAEDITPV